MLWADPDTQLTTNTSGLPPGRRIHAYTFAPPCVASAALGKRVRKVVHSFVLGDDVVPRFSLGHVLDLRSAGAWICAAGDEGNQIFSRAKAFREASWDSVVEEKLEEASWVRPVAPVTSLIAQLIAMRSTLEANMTSSNLFPAGDVYWLTDDVHLPEPERNDESYPPSRDETASLSSNDDVPAPAPAAAKSGPRLYRVTGDVGVVFRQITWSSSMLTAHLPRPSLLPSIALTIADRYEKAIAAL